MRPESLPPRHPAGEISRRINAEIVVVLGWGRAILLQLAHPLVAAAIADRSVFAANARAYARRSMQTVGAMLSLTFGTDADARATAAHINRIHESVNGTLREAAGVFPAGTTYDATNPALLNWVHATLLESLPITYAQFVGPLTPDEHDEYCLEASMLGDMLRFSGPWVPTSWSELQQYMDRMYASGEIHVTPAARATADQLLTPAVGPAAPLVRPFMRRLTLGLLPSAIRASYGYGWDASDERAFRAYVRLIRGLRSILPDALCEWPAARRAKLRS